MDFKHDFTMVRLLTFLLVSQHLLRCSNADGTSSNTTSPNSSSLDQDGMAGNTSNITMDDVNMTEDLIEGVGEKASHSIHVAKLNLEEVELPLIIVGVVLIAALFKIVFHHMKFIASRVPESCLLIIIGVGIGAILHYSGLSQHLPHFFEPHHFFLYLLPPIILDASFSLHDRVVFNNFGSILTFAIIGTVLACFAVGYTMYGLALSGAMGDIVELGAAEILIFSSLIVAVDPVAVLAVFEEVGVNNVLYFMVFGESLLNDGVTVVLYNVMHEINEMDHVDGIQILLGVVTFLVVAGGGTLIGIIIGVISAIITKYTHSVTVVEPIVVFIFAYLSFIVADAFTLSGIISMIACGLVQSQYTFPNVSRNSRTTIKYFTKVLSTTNEIVIFIFLGLELFRFDHVFHVGFILWAILLTLVYRFIITFGLSFLLNKDRYRVRKISFQEQFIISYGGLRGAVAFSLVGLLEENEVHSKQLFVTATLSVIIFTVFIQGITIKPLVRLFKVKMASTHKPALVEEVMGKTIDSIMAGMENILKYHGNYHLKEVLEHYNQTYLRTWFLRQPHKYGDFIIDKYLDVVLSDHLDALSEGGADLTKSPRTLRHIGKRPASTVLDGFDDQLDETTNDGIEIEVAHLPKVASMTSADMINLLDISGTDVIRRSSGQSEGSDPEQPDILKKLEEHHSKVQRFTKRRPVSALDYRATGSWNTPQIRKRLGFSHLLEPRPRSFNMEPGQIPHNNSVWTNNKDKINESTSQTSAEKVKNGNTQTGRSATTQPSSAKSDDTEMASIKSEKSDLCKENQTTEL